ncbi:CHASE3 domain-containing protein [Lichenifustis flavocetrariae]|uniref:CHASE3 domain-containing protein n=1 Tax=Lichenifustis flavocetrariae TaxID=2949735 RepID=A0AA42CIT1_9HYPH|nr:CHASE3 domain-containing protein [Lichenifustis flavocetrariae]MCW6508868.1 CHASE3 domain-containing protein [Lichenifustis flavocetrariae]
MSIRSFVRDYLSATNLLRLVPISIVLVTGVVLTTWTHRLLSDHRDLVVHTHEVIEMAKDVLIGLDDAETGQRGYLLSGERRDLEPYGHARERLGWMSATLKEQLADNSQQTAHFAALSTLMQTKLGELQAAIDVRDKAGFKAALATERASTERATMDAIRHEIGQITEGEKALLSARDAEVQKDERRVQLVAILVGLASLLTRAGVELYITRKQLAQDRVTSGVAVSRTSSVANNPSAPLA